MNSPVVVQPSPTLPAALRAAQLPGLVVTDWELVVKRYAIGDKHVEHQDLYGGAARRCSVRRHDDPRCA